MSKDDQTSYLKVKKIPVNEENISKSKRTEEKVCAKKVSKKK